jgi:enterobacterial common antigen flippase
MDFMLSEALDALRQRPRSVGFHAFVGPPPPPSAARMRDDLNVDASGTAATTWFSRRALSETALVNVALLGLGLLTGVLTARLLGPHGRGVLAVALAVSGFASLVVGMGLQQAFAYRIAIRRAETGQAVGLSIWMAVTVGMLTFAIGFVVAGLVIPQEETAEAIQLALVAIPVGLLAGNLTGVLQGLRRGRAFNLLRLAPPAAYGVLLATAAFAPVDLSVLLAIAIYVAANFIAAMIALMCLRPAVNVKIPPRSFTSKALKYGLVVNLGSLAYSANRYLSLVALAAVATTTQVGWYSVAIGYSTPVGVIAQAIALHTLPDIAAETTQPSQASLARARIKVAGLMTVPLMLGAVAAAPVLLPFAFGQSFVESVSTAQVLALGQTLLGMGHVLSEISRGLGRPGLPAAAEGTGALATVILLLLIVPEFGILGAAVVSVVVYAMVVGVLYLGLRAQLWGAR